MATADTSPAASTRIAVIDIARGVALLAMASFHFTWDLGFFGYTDPALTEFGAWKIYARCIASSFLFLVGVSLFLAHGRRIRWNGFWKRFAMVAGAALAITAVTYFAVPQGFIFFGILHEIALASLLGLLFVALPSPLTLVLAALVIAAPHFARSATFDHPALWWVGLSSADPRSNDYVPLFPWFGAVLAGIGVARLSSRSGLLSRLAAVHPRRWTQPLTFLGRHSLAFYLIHQPVLIGCVWLFSQIMPAHVQTRQEGFLQSCQRTCQETEDAEFCSLYCVCMLDAAENDGSLDKIYGGDTGDALKAHINDLAAVCTGRTEGGLGEGTP